MKRIYRILVADDEPSDLYLLKHTLQEAGHSVVTCTDGAAAFTAAQREHPDAIVADALMPGMDGFQLCQRARRDPLLSPLPIILVSATYTDREDEALAQRVGADAYLRKPDDMPRLAQVVGETIEHVRRAAPRAPLASAPEREITETYARRLATKMESKIVELRAANEALRVSEEEVRKLNRRLEATVGELQVGITERRRVAELLYLAQKVGRIGSWSIDLDTGITWCSPEAAAILGQPASAGELNWDRLVACVPESERERTRAMLQRQASPVGEFDFELQFRLPEVGERILLFRSEVFGGVGAGAGRRIGTLQDVTAERAAEHERRQLERRLGQASKLEAVGRLAAGIAHDFNNILAAVVSHAELVRLAAADLPEDHDIRTSVEEIMQASFRARDLIEQILTFTRQQKAERALVQLGKVAQEVVRLLRPTLPLDVEATVHVAPECAPVSGSESQLHQVLVNLCRNAVQAMEATGGSLDVHLAPISVDESFAAAHPPLRPGRAVLLRVSDTGVGIDPSVVPNLFEPFFSTRTGRGGTGLGLAVVHGIVTQHEGCIHVESTPGKGSVFSVWLPATSNEDPAHVGEGKRSASASARRVLVVDDEPSIAAICARLLGRLGFQAEAVTDPLVARERLLANPQSFDLVLTDYAMPRLNGVELARTAWAVRPGLPVVLAAGYGGALTRESAMAMGFRDLVAKPYSMETLMSVCTAALI
ncbi:hypothetical protein ASA1KI_10960 [Opitutales bacterium ASA1]|uniref:ATP-binding response regulator n=1 Tax=Congregicoccus parvus TaxID=3081749 RepID=UPI002B2D0A66|nr:hypothetical protein ASA1KI_10960 [Opitutales bacterium ASA1]